MKSKLAFLIFAAMSGFAIGNISLTSPDRKVGREITSAPDSINDYQLLPCPSETEFLELARAVKLAIPDGDYVCNDSVKAKIAKVLFFMSKLQTNMPDGWGGTQREALENPLQYVSNMTNALKIDFSQVDSIAQNLRSQREIYLGGLFFHIDPLFAIAVLIHESRHSNRDEPGHTRCKLGDIPKTNGGCDESFAIHSLAGAYSYHTVFEFGLSQFSNLGTADREYLRSLALVHLASRFNYVPEELAIPRDILISLNDQGEIFQIDPFTFKAKKLELPIPSGDQAIRIELNPLNAGIFIFTRNGRLYSWSSTSGFEAPYENLIGENLKIVDADKVYNGASQYTNTMFVTDNNDLLIVDTDKKTGDRILKNYRTRPTDKMKKAITATGWSGYLLTQEGQVMLILSMQRGRYTGGYYAPYKPFTNSGLSFDKIYGGVTYDQLFGVTHDGRLFLEGKSNEFGLTAIPSELNSGTPVTKYQEGLNLRMLLDKQGVFYSASFSESRLFPFKVNGMNGKAIDFVLAREFLLDPILQPTKEAGEVFKRNCDIQSSIWDPVGKSSLGINRSGQLVIEASGTCQGFSPAGKRLAPKIRFMGTTPTADSRLFSISGLELFGVDGSKIILQPYRGDLAPAGAIIGDAP